MSLRPNLLYTLPRSDFLAELARLLEIIEEAQEESAVAAAVKEFNSRTEKAYDLGTFRAYYGAMSAETFLARAAQRPPQRISDITTDELVAIVSNIKSAATEAEQYYYIELFDANVSKPGASGLLYYPPEGSTVPVKSWDPTPEEVVALALRYKPILL